MADSLRPKVGVAVIVIKDGMVALGKRRGSHGDGTWAFPGGHLEFQESLEDCARREVLEETGLEIKNIRFSTITNDIFSAESKHYITIYMIADYKRGELKIMEPEKCEFFGWFPWGEFPRPRFIPLENLLNQDYKPL